MRSDTHALKREVEHRLGADIEVGKLISFVSHPYEHYVVDLFLYECTLTRGPLEVRNVNAFRWVTSAEFDQYPVHSSRRSFDEQAPRSDLEARSRSTSPCEAA